MPTVGPRGSSRDPSATERGSRSASVTAAAHDAGIDDHQTSSPPQDEAWESSDDRAPVMSIFVRKSRLGCAVMQWQEQRILLLESVEIDASLQDAAAIQRDSDSTTTSDDAEDDSVMGDSVSGRDVLDREADRADLCHMRAFILQYRPESIVVASNTPIPILAALERSASLVGSRILSRTSKEFNFRIGSVQLKTLLTGGASMSMQLPQDGASARAAAYAASLRLSSRLDLVRSQLSVSASAPLLQIVKGDRDMPSSLAIEVLYLDGVLGMPEDTIQSLSIFDEQSHASVHAAKGKEGLSVMTLLSLNSSRHSLLTLRRWLTFPLCKAEGIEDRLDAVESLASDECHQELSDVRAQLSCMANVPRLVFMMLKGLSSLSSWDKLFKYLQKSCVAMMRCVSTMSQSPCRGASLLRKIISGVQCPVIEDLVGHIETTIDWQDSKAQGRVTLRRGIDDPLDKLREAYAGLPDLLDRVATGLRNEPAFAESSSLHVVYFPQIGYLIVIPVGNTLRSDCDPTLSHQFSSNTSVYLKNDKMLDLDQHLGDLASFIVDREIELLEELQQELVRAAPALTGGFDAMMQLDCLMAFARAATLYGYTRPKIVDEPMISLHKCRHPLKELSDDSFVPNDIHLRGGLGVDQTANLASASSKGVDEGDDRSILIVTGANSSGKSCLLQQAGLAVFLAHCGSFVPASKAEIGIFDRILTRMKQDESVASEGSSFAKELRQLSRALSASTKRSLVLLDEVGKGCRADDGAGLFCAAITEFLFRRQDCPIVLAATHHLQAITHVLPPSLPIALGHMQTVLVSPSATQRGRRPSAQPILDDEANEVGTEQQPTFLYRLRPGLATSSLACHCAALCGVPASVVARAREIAKDSAAACRLPPEDEARLRNEERIARAFVEFDLQQSDDDEEGVDEGAVGASNASSLQEQEQGYVAHEGRYREVVDDIRRALEEMELL